MRKDLLAYIALAAICLIWGTTYLGLRIAVMHFPPFLFVAIRQVAAGVIMLAGLYFAGRAQWAGWAHLGKQAIAGFFMLTLGNGLVAYAELVVPSGIAAIICSLMPIVAIVMNVTIKSEDRPNLPIIIGVILGFAGIIMIFYEDVALFGTRGYLSGIILIFIGVLAWSGCSIWIKKKNQGTDMFTNAAWQMFFAGVWLFGFSFLFDDLSNVTWSPEAGYAMVYLTLIGSIVAFTCYMYVLRHLPLTIASLYAYVNPIVAVILGWLVLDEKLNAKMGLAVAVTLAGIYLVNRGYQLRNIWKTQVSANR